MPARDYPDKRVARGVAKEAELRMLSARIDPALMEYIRITAYETRKSKQEIVAEALALHRQKVRLDHKQQNPKNPPGFCWYRITPPENLMSPAPQAAIPDRLPPVFTQMRHR